MFRLAAIAVCICVIAVSSILLLRYAFDYFKTKRLNADLASQYHVVDTTAVPTATPVTAETDTLVTALPEVQPTKTQTTVKPAATYDPFGGYPDNPYREVLPQFKTLHRTSQDICGWITIGSDLDQAVVQRDNTYYLNHDHTGRHNANGAIFLDEEIKLWQRPTCYILYGHNMKTQEMFGMLRKYDKVSYLREHAIITFNTQYEDGQFAVFAVGSVFLDSGSARFVNFYDLPNAKGETRTAIIDRLAQVSDYKISLDVSEEDQLLLLVTCVDDDRERRIVAARRLRDGESADSLRMTYILA